MPDRLVTASARAWLAALVLVATFAMPSTAQSDLPQVPFRYSIKVSKSGSGTKLRRLAFAYPTAGVLTTGCTRGTTGTGPCEADGTQIKGITCTDGADGMTKCELASTKSAPLVYDKGATLVVYVSQRDHLASSLKLTFTGRGRYRASGNLA